MEQAFTTSLLSSLPMFSVVLPNFSLDVLPQQMWVDPNVTLSNISPTDAQGTQMAQIPSDICMEQEYIPKPLATLSTANTEPRNTELKSRVRKTTANINAQSRAKKIKAKKENEEDEDPYQRLYSLTEALLASDKENNPHNSGSMDTATLISNINNEVIKLKNSTLLSSLPQDFLIKLLQGLDDVLKPYIGKAATMEWSSISTSLEACGVILHILNTPNMPKALFMEEIIETILKCVKELIQENIVNYYNKNQDKEDLPGEEKTKKKKSSNSKKNNKKSSINNIVNLCTNILDRLYELCSSYKLTDSLILELSTMTIPLFFIEDLHTLQISSINLISTVFNRYPNCRSIIFEDIFLSLNKLPKSAKGLRNYVLLEDSKKSIMMVSALVLQLIQCCPILPEILEKKKSLGVAELSEESSEEYFNFNAALSSAKIFVNNLLSRCAAQSTTKKSDNDYISILNNIVDDLLCTFSLPEWPASSYLLQFITNSISSTISKPNENPTLRCTLMETLGNILAKLKYEILTYGASLPEFIQKREEEITDDEDSSCICNKGFHGEFMLDCDGCHKWFHGECVGVRQSADVTSWYCGLCATNKKLTEDINTVTDSRMRNLLLLKQIILNYLASRSPNDSNLIFSRQFYLCQWRDDELDGDLTNQQLSQLKQYYASQWSIDSQVLSSFKTNYLDRTSILKATGSLNCINSSFYKSFDILLKNILSTLADNNANLRSKSLKALSLVIAVDPLILGNTSVQNAVKSRFQDQSISVREAAVDLVGKYASSKVEFIEKYYPIIVERILDKGVSVRKRVVRILRDICLKQPNHSLIPKICVQLVTRINDEESIRDLILKTFQELWFSEKQIVADKHEDIKWRADLIANVVSTVSNHDWLVELIEKLIGKEIDKKNPIYIICSNVCSSLIDRLLEIEDKRADKEHDSLAAQFLSCICTLNVFCLACPNLLIPHVTTLQPYLKPTSNKIDAILLFYTAGILENVVPLIKNPDSDFLTKLQNDLQDPLHNQGIKIVQSCIKCLCSVVFNVTSQVEILETLFSQYYQQLQNAKSAHAKYKKTIIRSLVITSLLYRYFDFNVFNKKEGITAKSKKFEELMSSIIGTYIEYTNSTEEDIKVHAIEAIGNVFIRAPPLVIKLSTTLINKCLLPSTSSDIKSQILKNFSDFLTEEDARIKKRHSKEEEGVSALSLSRINEEQGITSILPFVPSILRLLFDKDVKVRLASLTTVNLIVRHGLFNPLECIPYLIALQTDQARPVAEKSFKLLSHIEEKHPTYIPMRGQEGIKKAFEFQMSLFQKTDPFTTTQPRESNLAEFYYLIKGKHRISFLNTLIKTFEDSQETEYLYFKYIAEILASLPYSTEEEPLYLIYHINRIVSLSGSSLLSSLKPLFNSNKDLSNDLSNKCKMLLPMTLLLQLKKYLKSSFNLTDNKCQAYNPSTNTLNDKPFNKLTEAIVFDNQSSPFSSLTPPINNKSSSKSDFNTLSKQFQQFKELMKEDQIIDYNMEPKIVKTKTTKKKARDNEDSKKKSKAKTKARKTKRQKKLEEEEEEEEAEE